MEKLNAFHSDDFPEAGLSIDGEFRDVNEGYWQHC